MTPDIRQQTNRANRSVRSVDHTEFRSKSNPVTIVFGCKARKPETDSSASILQIAALDRPLYFGFTMHATHNLLKTS